MPTLRGRNAVAQREAKLKSKLALVDNKALDSELLANYARYFCVLLAGFAEQSLKELLSEHARTRSSSGVHRHVEISVNKIWGINRAKLQALLDSFDEAWYATLCETHEEHLEALHSVGKLRDSISHGSDSGVTMTTIIGYSEKIFELFRSISDMVDPKSDPAAA